MRSLPDPLLHGTPRDYAISHLLETSPVECSSSIERNLLAYVLPPWQRDEVWSDHQKRRFIEGIFLGLGTGYYVVHAPDWDECGQRPMSGWLIDGQQRLTSIRDFVAGQLSIFDGIRFGDLDLATRRKRFLRVTFPCLELAYQDNEERLRNLYERLNFGGTAHTLEDRERLHSTPRMGLA